MATSELIGYGACPVCGHTSCRFGLTVKGHVCAVCNACNAQVFGRSDASDLRLKSLVRRTSADPAPPAPTATPAPSQAPTQPTPAAPAPAPRRRGVFADIFD